MKTGMFVWFSVTLMCASSITAAENGNSTEHSADNPVLIDADQLERKLNDITLRILDVRSQNEYAKGHIPGAVRVDVGDWKNLSVADNGLRDTEGWTKKVSQLGLEKDMHVAVYGSKLSDSARIWWLLKYVGVEHAALLNGGWEWWTKQERPTETSTPDVTTTEFQAEFQADRLEEIDSLKESLISAKINFVDTRSIGEFSSGRIPDSVHLEWKELVAEGGRFKSKKQLQQLFHDRGIVPTKTAVCY